MLKGKGVSESRSLVQGFAGGVSVREQDVWRRAAHAYDQLRAEVIALHSLDSQETNLLDLSFQEGELDTSLNLNQPMSAEASLTWPPMQSLLQKREVAQRQADRKAALEQQQAALSELKQVAQAKEERADKAEAAKKAFQTTMALSHGAAADTTRKVLREAAQKIKAEQDIAFEELPAARNPKISYDNLVPPGFFKHGNKSQKET